MRKDIYFISDAHLSSGNNEIERIKQEQLVSFLQSLRGNAEALYIVGDLFDFWFEYRSVVPRGGAKVIFELYNLICSGTRVVYIAGNHDFWIDSFLSDEIGIELSRAPLDVYHQGLKIHIAHGDSVFFEGSIGDKVLRAVLRNSLSIWLFRLLHPDLGAVLAQLVSRSERESPSAVDRQKIENVYRKAAEVKFKEGFDAVVFGHIHLPIQEGHGRGMLIVLGDWINHFSYALLRDGRLQLKKWGCIEGH